MKATGRCSKCDLPREVGKKCKPCEAKRCSARNKRLRAANPERARARDRKFHQKYIDKRHAANNRWHAEHPEKQKEYDARKDPVKERARCAAYRAAHRVEIRDRKNARYAANVDRFRAIGRISAKIRRVRYRERLNAELRAYSKTEQYRRAMSAYRKAHPEIGRAANARRRARAMGALVSHTKSEWNALKKKFGFRCGDCRMLEGELFGQSAGPAWVGKAMLLSRGHRVPLQPCAANGWLGGSDAIFNIVPQCMPCNLKQGSKLHGSVRSLSLFDRVAG